MRAHGSSGCSLARLCAEVHRTASAFSNDATTATVNLAAVPSTTERPQLEPDIALQAAYAVILIQLRIIVWLLARTEQ